MKRLVPLVLIAAIVTAYNGKPDPGGTSGSARPGGGGQVIPAPTEDNIGDLEQAALISVAVAQKSQGPNVEATPLVDASGRMNLFTVDIAPPLPNELWLDFKVESRRSFPKNPGVLRIVIQDGEQVLDTFGTVIGKSAKPSVAERSVNVLAARTSLPDTMLVTIAVEALLMPDGTDPDTIDPMTAEVSEERYSLAVATPPVRINVKSAAAPPPAAPAAAAPEEPGAAAAGPPAEGAAAATSAAS